MTAILLPRRHYTQPRGRTELDANWGATAAEYPGRSVLHNATVVAEAFGAAWSLNGSNQFVDLGALSGGDITIGALISQGSSINSFPLSSRASSGGNGIEILAGPGGTPNGATGRAQTSGGSYDTSTSISLTAGRFYFHVVTWTPGQLRHFVEGTPRAITSAFGTLSHSQPLYVGRRGTTYFAGRVGLAFAIPRRLEADEVFELYNNPWQLFRADPVRIYSLGAEGVFNLDIFNALHAQAADTPTLTTNASMLGIDAGTHAQQAERKPLDYPGLFAQDDFLLDEGLLDDRGWVKHPSYSPSMTATNGYAVTTGVVGTHAYYLAAGVSDPDYAVCAGIYIIGMDKRGLGVAGRVSSTTDTMYYTYYETAAGAWRLYKRVSGTDTLLGSYAQTLDFLTTYRLRLSMSGDQIEVSIDDVLRISATDNSITDAGYAGLRTEPFPPTGAGFGAMANLFAVELIDGVAETLDTDDATHTHTAPTIDLSALLNLVTTDGTHTHTADSVTLGSAHALAPASATHAHSAEALDLSAGLALTVADALHAQQADSPTLTAAHTLNVAASLHAHTADQPPLSAALTLAVAAALHAQSAERRQLTYPGLFAQDDFFGSAAGTELSAHNAQWVKHPGYTLDFVVNADERVVMLATGTTATAYYLTEAPSSPDYVVSADLVVTGAVAPSISPEVGVIGRASATAVTFYHGRYNSGSGQWQLFKFVNSTATQLGAVNATLTETTYRLQLEMIGTQIRLLVDGVQVISVTDSSITTAGRAGIRCIPRSVPARIQLDNFAAHTLSGVAADLSTNNALHAHTAQTPTLGSTHTVVTSSATHGQTADATTLSAAHSLIASNATHAHAAGSPALDVGLSLAPADAVHAHLAESLALSAAHSLVVANAQHDHSASTVAMSAVLNLLVEAAVHAHTAGSLTLDTANAVQLVTQDATHAQTAEQLALSTALTLVAQSAIHTHGADVATLSANLGLSISGSTHAHTADNVSAASGISLTVQSAFHAHIADGLALDAALSLAIHDALHAHHADALTLTTLVNLLISDAIHAHQASNPTLYLPVPAAELLRKSVFVRLAELGAVTRLSRQGATTRVSDERAFVRTDDPTNFTRH